MKRLGKILLVVAALLIIAFVIFRTPDTDPAEMRAKYGTAPSQFVELDGGLTVHLRDEGPRDGVPIILLHGSNSDLLTWNPWVQRLSDTYRIIRFDQPGHGLTGASPDEDYSVATYVKTIDRVADKLGLKTFYLGGNSMGGGHTLAYAIEHPDRVRGLILVDASGAARMQSADKDEGGNIGFTIARMPGLNQIMKHITPRSVVEKSFRQSVSNQAIVTPEAVDRYWEMLRYPGNRAATISRFSRPNKPFSSEQLAALKMPALIIWGDKDALIPLASGQWLGQNLPNSEMVVFKNIGHLPMEEIPDESAQAVRSFMTNAAVSTPANSR
ncbi:MAG: alpha/beta hydrolase [Pontixanthobacter sp.]